MSYCFDNDDKIFKLVTKQTKLLKHIFKQIYNVRDSCCLTFNIFDKNNKENEESNVQTTVLSEDKTSMIFVKLNSSKFEYFMCKKNKLEIGIDLVSIIKNLNIFDNNDLIQLYTLTNDKNTLYLSSLDNKYKMEMKLIDISNSNIKIPKIKFDNMIKIEAKKFNNICKTMSNNFHLIEIEIINNKISFSNENEFNQITMSHCDTISKNPKTNKITKNFYEIADLKMFSIANDMNNYIEIYMNNDFPIFISLPISILGKMYFTKTPCKFETMNK